MQGAESEVAGLMARARTMMVISVLTTLLAIAAVVTVIGYRIYGGVGPPAEEASALPKGAHIVSMASSAGRLAVLFEVDGVSELRTFDIKTLKETGRLRFSSAP